MKLNILWAGVWSSRRMGNVMRTSNANSKDEDEHLESPQKGSEDDIAVVIQDYPSAEITEPIYRLGEKLRVHSREGYWWKVCSIKTGKENCIPKSHVARVYHGWLFEGVGRDKAEELLLLPGNRVGSFLVRESSTGERGLYSLSVKHQMVVHYRIKRMDNSWYYISPRLTFQCLEDMINHYSDSADGLCCALSSPCLSGRIETFDANQDPPVVMRHNFDWRKLDRQQLVSAEGHGENVVSYGVRNSIAAYLSLSAPEEPPKSRSERRKKKGRSVYAIPESNNANTEYEDDF